MGNLRKLRRGLWGGKRRTPKRIVKRRLFQALLAFIKERTKSA